MENSAALPPADVAGLLRAIQHRRSLGVARLKPDTVAPDLIQTLLEAADWAPSHGETEPWRFTVYTGDSRRALGEAFAQAYRDEAEQAGDFKEKTWETQRERSQGSPVWISLGLAPGLREDGTLRMLAQDEMMAVACAVQNMHLTASALGLAGMWLSKGVMVHPRTAAFVGLTPPSRLLGFFVAGWPNVPWPAGERRPLSEKVRWAERE